MGTLNIPPIGSLYVDSNTLIYSVQQHPRYSSLLAPLWQAQATGRHIVSSQLARMEVLVLPLRLQDTLLVGDYHRLFQQNVLELIPITDAILDEATRLRASIPALKTPDALHAATALLQGCTLFVTNDRALKRIPSLPVTILDDLL